MARKSLAVVAFCALGTLVPGIMLSKQRTVAAAPADAPAYAANGELLPPKDYRQWVFLTSGIDMSYSPKAMDMGHSMFDNVFVSPAAYRSFLATGTWPDKTILVLEAREAQSKGSINHSRALSGNRPHGLGSTCEG